MPTLLEPNKILKQSWMSKSDVSSIKQQISIEFLMDYIDSRMWDGATPPKFKLRGIGDRVLVLRSGTGSGKSTLLPPFLYKKYLLTGGNLIITQPTKATTIDIPNQIIQYNNFLKLGENIGYQTGSIKKNPSKGILFATYGILLQHLKMLTDEEFMKKYRFVIIDEVHTRTIEVDTCLFYLKKLLKKNWDDPMCPFVILTSATFDPKIFMNYFKCKKESFLDVVGATFPRHVEFMDTTTSNYILTTIDKILKIHKENMSDITNNELFRDILVFLQGGKQMKEISEAINHENYKLYKAVTVKPSNDKAETSNESSEKTHASYLSVIMANSANIQIGEDDYKNLFGSIKYTTVNIYNFVDDKPTDKILAVVTADRRVVLGTNAIETGITIDTLKYCIDTGFVKQSSFHPILGCPIIVDKPVTQASSEQRKGRIGRKAPGWFYPIYTKTTWEAMQELPFPDIIKEDVSQFILNIIIGDTETEILEYDRDDNPDISKNNNRDIFQMNSFDQQLYYLHTKIPFSIDSLDFVQPPSTDSINYSIAKLHGLGFIDHIYNPTLFGYYASKFRKIKLENIRMILAGYYYESNILDLITIVACLETGNIKTRDYKNRNPLELKESHANYYSDNVFSDEIIEYVFIWNDFMKIFTPSKNIAKGSKKESTTEITNDKVSKWCKTQGVNEKALLYAMELRDEIISDMLVMGLNPYYNELSLPNGKYNLVDMLLQNIYEGMSEFQKIKQSIYEGYRFSIFTWDSKTDNYINNNYKYPLYTFSKLINTNYNVDIIKQKRPMYIIAGDIIFKYNPMTKQHSFIGSHISVLDGFVDVDINFLKY